MAKFLLSLAAAACALVGAHAQEAAAVPAATTSPPPKLPCVPLSFEERAFDIASLNTFIGIAIQSGLLAQNLVAVDPLNIQQKTLEPVAFSVLGEGFELTPRLQNLTVTGIATVLPRLLNITTPQNLDLGADFNGTVKLDSTFAFEIRQVSKQWWEPCWTNLFKPKSCPPAVINVDLGIALTRPSVAANVLAAMVRCNPAAPRGTCKDLTVTDILVAAVSQQFDALLARILRRFQRAELTSLSLAFDSVSDIKIHFHTSGRLITALGEKLYAFTAQEINKKGDLYNKLIDLANTQLRNLVNQVLQERLAPSFGNACYDN